MTRCGPKSTAVERRSFKTKKTDYPGFEPLPSGQYASRRQWSKPLHHWTTNSSNVSFRWGRVGLSSGEYQRMYFLLTEVMECFVAHCCLRILYFLLFFLGAQGFFSIFFLSRHLSCEVVRNAVVSRLPDSGSHIAAFHRYCSLWFLFSIICSGKTRRYPT